MSRARCTLRIQGLDCPVEAHALHAAMTDAPGVHSLGFDLIHGSMTVDYDPALTGPDALVGRVADRAGMRAEPLGNPEVGSRATPPPGGRRSGRGADRPLRPRACLRAYSRRTWAGRTPWPECSTPLAVAAGGFELFPKAWRGLRFCGSTSTYSWRWRSSVPWPWGSGTRPRRSPSCSGSPRRWRR